MADNERDTRAHDYRQSAYIDEDIPNDPVVYREESAAEIAAPVPIIQNRDRDMDENRVNREKVQGGTGTGWIALALSILSLFVMPILFGIAGIVLGFIARRRGAAGLGAWSIGIGAISIVIGIFILPFF